MLYICTVHVSVRFLFENAHRLSAYDVKTQRPAVGWLVLEERAPGEGLVARLVDEGDQDLLPWLESAHVAASGRRGMLVRGVQHRKKGRKHSFADRQAWWVQAPPATAPIVNHSERMRAVQRVIEEQREAGWGND